jgi:transposase
MQVVYERCAGIDGHKKTAVGTVLCTGTAGKTSKATRTFSTMTAELGALAAWRDQEQVEQVAIESTGVYWWPVYNLLEDRPQVTLVNPQHMQAVPGHKPAVKDSEWLADLLRRMRHGLLKASFIPPAPPAADPRTARTHPVSEDAGPGAGAGGEPSPESAGERQRQQAGRRGQ